MTKWNKKANTQLKAAPYRSEDHGYGQLSSASKDTNDDLVKSFLNFDFRSTSFGDPGSLQRYNATLGCFEEVPRSGGRTDGLELGQAAPPQRKTRMKVMIKPYTNEEGEVVGGPGLSAPLAAQQRVARYEEVVEDDGQVVVHVPDSAAGPDGIIRLLQVTNEDGSVHYISADHTEIEEDFTMEDAMQMILTEVDHVAEHVTEDTQPIDTETMQEERAAAESQQEAEVKEECEDADLAEVAAAACYVCGQAAAADDAADDAAVMTPLMAGRSRHSATSLAELLADTVQRELTVSTADGVCAACLALLDQCDQPDGPLRKSASRHVRNVLSLRVGDLSAIEGAAGDTKRKRGRSRVGRPAEDGQGGQWTDPGAADDPQWTPFLDAPARGRATRRPREFQTGSPPPVEPTLEHLTDLTVPSETKRSARIAIRKNAYVANAVHASSRPRVLVVPDLQSKYFADPRPQRRPYRRLNMNPAKGRRGRPKLPNPPENEPASHVTVDAEETEKPADVEPDSLDPDSLEPAEEEEVGAETAAGPTAELAEVETGPDPPAGSDGQLLVEESGAPQTQDESAPSAEEPAAVPQRQEPGLLYVDVHEEPEEEAEWTPTPGCTCLMCTELTAEQRATLQEDVEFCTTYVCQVCGAELVGRKKYLRHENGCRLRQQNPRRRQPIIHECNTCQRTFKSARLRNEHYERSGHEKRSPCPVCHKFFHPDFLRIHLSSHSGAFFCRVCNTHFSSNATLRGHMYRHSGLKPHKCDVCSAAFRTPSSLFMHKRYHHSDDRPYVCNLCPKGFAARSTLKIHLRQHTGERPFVCKLCPKTYARKSSLTQHLRSHTQERRHACMTCGKRFDNKTYLKVHMNRHLGIRAHPCGRCGRGFYSRPNLLKHMQMLCYKEDYGRPEEEQLLRTRQLQAAAQLQFEQEDSQQLHGGLHMHTVEMDDDDIQTTEVILAIESIPENGELLVGHMVQ